MNAWLKFGVTCNKYSINLVCMVSTLVQTMAACLSFDASRVLQLEEQNN